MPAPTGADVVVPEPARFGGLRLAVMRARSRGRVRVRGRVRLGRDAVVRVAKGAEVVLEDGCYLGEGCRIDAVEGTVRIGERTLVGARAFVIGHRGVRIGTDCVVGDFAAVGVSPAPGSVGPVTIGERSRIAAHATVASGATVAPGSVLASYEGVDRTPEA